MNLLFCQNMILDNSFESFFRIWKASCQLPPLHDKNGRATCRNSGFEPSLGNHQVISLIS